MSFNNIPANRSHSQFAVWWRSRTPLEKVGVGALATVGAIAVTAVVAPGVFISAAGGALATAGAYLVRKGFSK